MVNELQKLYNTLFMVETKGESTKIMSDCIRFTEQLINLEKEKEKEVKAAKPPKKTTPKETDKSE